MTFRVLFLMLSVEILSANPSHLLQILLPERRGKAQQLILKLKCTTAGSAYYSRDSRYKIILKGRLDERRKSKREMIVKS